MKTLLVLALSLFLSSNARAEYVWYHFTGAVNPVEHGDIYGYASLITTVQDQDPSNERAYFPGAVLGLSVSRILGPNYVTGGPFLVPEQASGGTPWLTSLTVVQTQDTNFYTLDVPLASGLHASMIFESPSFHVTTVPSLSTITGGTYRVQGFNDVLFNARVIHVLKPIPLPPALWMFGAGLLVLVGIGRLRRVRRIAWCG